jgi:hypothetical protein
MPSLSGYSGGNKYEYMKAVKSIFFVMTGLALVLTAISSLLPGSVMNSRWVKVGVSRERVTEKLKDFNGWASWNLLLTDASDIRVSSATASNGASLAWKDPRGVSHGFTVTADNDGGLVTRLNMGSGRPMESGFAVQQNGTDSVQVVWYVIEDLKWYPWEKFYGIMAGDMKGPLLQGSLDKLKEILHAEAAEVGPQDTTMMK